MPEIPSLHPTLQGWLLDGPLAAYVPAYVDRLQRGRYASSTSQRCLNAVAHFAHWMSLCRLQAAKLDESRIDQFLQEHLPHCGCAAPVVTEPSSRSERPLTVSTSAIEPPLFSVALKAHSELQSGHQLPAESG